MSTDFYRRFEMQVRPSNRRLRRLNRPHSRFDPWMTNISDQVLYQDLNIEEVECVDIVVPKDRLVEMEQLLTHYEQIDRDHKHEADIVATLRMEERVRIKNPTVQKAYDQYRTLLNLVWE